MDKHYLIKVLEWASSKDAGFTYDELIKNIQFRDWELKVINQYCISACINYSRRTQDVGGYSNISETIFININGGNIGNFSDLRNLYSLTQEALFKYIDYQELKVARQNASEAKKFALWAIAVSVIGMLISIIIPFFVKQNVQIDNVQLDELKGISVLQNQNNTNLELFEINKQCSSDGKKVWELLIDKIESEPGDLVYGKNFEVHYNNNLKKCLLMYEYSYGEVQAKYIKDVYSNEKMISYFKNGEKEEDVTLENFTTKYNLLFEKNSVPTS